MNSELSSTKAKNVLVSVGQMEDLLLFFVISLEIKHLILDFWLEYALQLRCRLGL